MVEIFDESLKKRQPLATAIFAAALERSRLAHAYLVLGSNEEDKWQIASNLAGFLNCTETPPDHAYTAESCSCQNCSWIRENRHPQALITLESEGSKSGTIAVGKARQLSAEIAKTSPYFRVIVIPRAESKVFHAPAANALLKTIEEPGQPVVFFLFAEQKEEVLPTIASRCQTVPVVMPLSFDRTDTGTEEGPGLPPYLSGNLSLAEALNWAKEIDASPRAQEAPQDMIDQLVWYEMERVGKKRYMDPDVSRYLRGLLNLSEAAKSQLSHFVQSKNVFESFALAWRQLAEQDLHGYSRGRSRR